MKIQDVLEERHVNRVLKRGGLRREQSMVREIPPHSLVLLRNKNFTVAIVTSGRTKFVGVTKRQPTDILNDDVGARIATMRALKSMFSLGGMSYED